MKPRKALPLVGVVFVFLSLVMPTIFSSQERPSPAIAKEGLLKSLGMGALSSEALIREVKRRGVDFQLSPPIEQEIRNAGKYLGKRGVDDLIEAIRDNYQSEAVARSSSSSIVNQTMTNSPGGVQAGRDVVIQSDKRLINSLEIRIAIDIETPEAKTTTETYDWGLGSVVALFTTDKTRIRFLTDDRVYDQQVTTRLRRLGFIYSPESLDQVNGREIEFLVTVDKLAVNYREIFEKEKFGLKHETLKVHVSVRLNGINIGELTATAPPGALVAEQPAVLDVSSLFRQIPKIYSETVSAVPKSQSMTGSPGAIQAGGNVTINQGIQPRKLTGEQEASFVKFLKDNPTGRVDITCIESGGPEPCQFARQLARLLTSKDAGWSVNLSPLMFGAGDPTKTIPEMYILVKKGNVPSRAGVLQSALKIVGFNAVGIEREDIAADFVQLTIWFKQQ